MTALNRRRFLQLAGGTAGLSMLPQSIARAASIAADRRSGTIKDVKHIVVLMQENRSFDHYFGRLKGVRGFGDPRPMTLPNGKPVWNQSNGTKDILPFRPQADDLGMKFLAGLNHDWAGGHKAFNNGRYDQWIPAKSAGTMAYLEREDIPFHYALADQFTVCDAYHCSFIGATDPNRYYMWTGYTGNDGKGRGPVLGNDEAGYAWTTYPERLEQAGVSWKVYQDVGDGLDAAGFWGWTDDAFIGNYGDNSLLYFDNYRNSKPGDALYEKALTGTNMKSGQGTYFDVLKSDVLGGTLPDVSYIAAPEAFSEHPNWPVNFGAWYIAKVLDALTADPEVWAQTVLLVTYDENDGFFDHVVPPFPPSSANQGLSTADVSTELYPGSPGKVAGPYGLGPRVPMIAISPWSKGGFVNSQTFDHTSIIRFIEQRFGVSEPNISPWRRAVCGDLTSVFDFGHQPDPTSVPLPSTAGYVPADRDRHPDFPLTPPATGLLPKQEKGARPARKLPYDLEVTGEFNPAGKFVMTFTSGDKVGAAYYITSANRSDDPWTYTVEAGRSLSDAWTVSGAYDFSVYGPNGFLREFKGDRTAVAPIIEIIKSGDRGNMRVRLTNPGTTALKVVVTDGYGTEDVKTVNLRPGQVATWHSNLHGNGYWYDVTVTSGTYVRRLAGHVETDRPSTSDPAIATV